MMRSWITATQSKRSTLETRVISPSRLLTAPVSVALAEAGRKGISPGLVRNRITRIQTTYLTARRTVLFPLCTGEVVSFFSILWSHPSHSFKAPVPERCHRLRKLPVPGTAFVTVITYRPGVYNRNTAPHILCAFCLSGKHSRYPSSGAPPCHGRGNFPVFCGKGCPSGVQICPVFAAFPQGFFKVPVTNWIHLSL